jgi:hypothetical protein
MKKMKNETFFSQIDFIKAVVNCSGGHKKILPIQVVGSGPKRQMYGIQEFDRFGRRSVSLGPFGLYASPGWNENLEIATLRGIIKRLTSFNTLKFVWTVRADHGALADSLISLGIKYKPRSTHLLYLDPDYEKVFSGYSATMRNQIRRAKKEGVSIEKISDREDIKKYYDIYISLAKAQQRPHIYPIELFYELAAIPEQVQFLGAIWQGKLTGGGVFFRDGCTGRYWHGAADRQYSKLFATCALVDHAIREASLTGATFFNFGASIGISTLEQFKTYWGARKEFYWEFHWTNPFWLYASIIRNRIISFSRRALRGNKEQLEKCISNTI